ncbi:MAG: agmatinase [Thermoplasmata archaeon]|nr:agmatinase [Thermoplasmata archaeon]MCI4341037.1 agmatinase [Thermoplasmata archaeon]
MERPGLFADAHASYADSRYVVLGVPFDRTTSFRPGARFGPDSIRQHSWNFETFDLETGVDLADVPIHDLGNAGEFGSAEEMVRSVREEVAPLYADGKIPITLGGDHACAPPCVEAFPAGRPLSVVYLDAHLDFRDSYLGDARSHACSARRIAERVGMENIVVIGVRSASKEEIEAHRKLGLTYISAHEVSREGIDSTVRRALERLRPESIYVSLDIDVVDPAYAGGTGTPEPFGLTSRDIKQVIDTVAPRLVGLDIMEVSPPYDQGNTSALAARLAREAIVRSHLARGQP